MLTSFMGRALRLIGFSDTMSGLVRMVGIEVLARAEALLQDLPEEMAATMGVLLERRNAIVLEALEAATLPASAGSRSVGVLYGAAHQGAFQAALESWGYEAVEDAETWRVAARVDLDDLGLPWAQVDWTRRMLSRRLTTSVAESRARVRTNERGPLGTSGRQGATSRSALGWTSSSSRSTGAWGSPSACHSSTPASVSSTMRFPPPRCVSQAGPLLRRAAAAMTADPRSGPEPRRRDQSSSPSPTSAPGVIAQPLA